jgi:hypothetical protein
MIAAQASSSQRHVQHGHHADANTMSDEYELHEILLRCRRIEKKLDGILVADNATHDSVVSKSTQQKFTRWLRKLTPRRRTRSPTDAIVAP